MFLFIKKLTVKTVSIVLSAVLIPVIIVASIHRLSNPDDNNNSITPTNVNKKTKIESEENKQKQQLVNFYHNVANFYQLKFDAQSELEILEKQVKESVQLCEDSDKHLTNDIIEDFRAKLKAFDHNRIEQFNKLNLHFEPIYDLLNYGQIYSNDCSQSPILNDHLKFSLRNSLDDCALQFNELKVKLEKVETQIEELE